MHSATSDPRTRPRGVNVVGYLFAEHGVGEEARQLARVVREAGLEVALVPVVQTGSRQTEERALDLGEGSYDTNLVCLNADSLESFVRQVGPTLFAGRINIGMWAWELELLPPWMLASSRFLDEIWTCSRFVTRAVAPSVSCSVVSMPPSIALLDSPPPPTVDRVPGSKLFLFCFDYNSVFERKNPLGTMAAFVRAFAPDDGCRLLIKTVNGASFPAQQERLRTAAAEHSHVHVVDGYLAREEQHVLMASCDVYVSLHRSEGFGFTLAEAMALGKPVVATGYSGNLEFLDDSCGYLVPWQPAGVGPGSGPYPVSAWWAEPDLDAAAGLMRRVVLEPKEAEARAKAAQKRIRETLSVPAAARRVRERLEQIWAVTPRGEAGSVETTRTRSREVHLPDGRLVVSSRPPATEEYRSFPSAATLLADAGVEVSPGAGAEPLRDVPRRDAGPPAGAGPASASDAAPDSGAVEPSASAREWIRRMGLALVSLAVGIGLAEAGLRALEGARHFPSIDGDSVDLAALGYNEGTVPRRSPRDQIRVLSFGDSFAHAAVRPSFTYHAVAASLVGEVRPDRKLRVINLGESGTSFHQYMDRHRRWSQELEHAAVVFNIYLGNDLLEVALGHVADDEPLNPLFAQVELEPSRMPIPRRFTLRLLDYGLAAKLLLDGSYRPYVADQPPEYLPTAGVLSDDAFYGVALSQIDNFDAGRLPSLRRGYEAMFRFMAFVAEIRARGIPVAILLAPSETQVDPDLRRELARRFGVDWGALDLGLPAALIAEAADRLAPNVPLLDLTPAFRTAAVSSQEKLYWRTNTHWSVAGNALAGHCLADLLARSLWSREVGRTVSCPVGEAPPLAPEVRANRKRVVDSFLLPLLEGRAPGPDRVDPAELEALRKREVPARFALGMVNGLDFDELGDDRRIPVGPSGLSMSGWAIDSSAMRPAAGVLVAIGDRFYRAEYGASRSDVARHFGDWTLHRVGFTLAIPAGEIEVDEVLRVRVFVLGADGESYEQGGPIEMRRVLEEPGPAIP